MTSAHSAASGARQERAVPDESPVSCPALQGVFLEDGAVVCWGGDTPAALIETLNGQKKPGRMHPTYFGAGFGGDVPAFYAPLPDSLPRRPSRVEELACRALGPLLATVQNTKASRVLVRTLLPSPDTHNLEALDALIQEAGYVHRAGGSDQGATASLAQVLLELSDDRWDVVIFGGVDSLIGVESLAALDRCGTLATTSAMGQVPSEACAYVSFRKRMDPESEIQIKGVAYAAESHPKDADRTTMQALPDALQALLKERMLRLDGTETVILPDVTSRTQCEWWQVNQRFWPIVNAVDQKVAAVANLPPPQELPQPTVITVSAIAGHVGAATLAVALVFAQALLEKGAGTALILEPGTDPARGVVCLQKAAGSG